MSDQRAKVRSLLRLMKIFPTNDVEEEFQHSNSADMYNELKGKSETYRISEVRGLLDAGGHVNYLDDESEEKVTREIEKLKSSYPNFSERYIRALATTPDVHFTIELLS